MSIDLRGLRVFVASPGGLEDERDRFREVLREYSEQDAHERGVAFIPVGWESTRAGIGRPQSLINAQIESCDFLLLILHERWGSPPGDSPIGADFTSGTEEEFTLAMKLVRESSKNMVDVAVLFKHVEPARLADPGPQLLKVIDFKKKLERERAVLYWTFGSTDEFEKRLRQLLLEWIRLPPKSSAAMPFSRGGQVQAGEGAGLGVIEREKQDVLPPGSHSALVSQALVHANEGRLVEAEQAFARAVLDAGDFDAHLEFGKFLERLGRHDEAQEVFSAMGVEAQRRADPRWESRAIRGLGAIAMTRGELVRAEKTFEVSRTLAEQALSDEDVAACLGNLGVIEQRRGNLAGAEAYHKKSLEIHEKHGCLDGMASNYGNLGVIEQMRGNLNGADPYHKKSLEIHEKLGRLEGMAIHYSNLGLTERTRGNLDGAEAYHKTALEINEKLGRLEGMATNYSNLGLIERARGKLEGAKSYLAKSRDLYQKIGAKDREADVQRRLDELK